MVLNHLNVIDLTSENDTVKSSMKSTSDFLAVMRGSIASSCQVDKAYATQGKLPKDVSPFSNKSRNSLVNASPSLTKSVKSMRSQNSSGGSDKSFNAEKKLNSIKSKYEALKEKFQ